MRGRKGRRKERGEEKRERVIEQTESKGFVDSKDEGEEGNEWWSG